MWSHTCVLISELEKCRFERWTVCWKRNWLDGSSRRVVSGSVSHMKAGHEWCTSGLPYWDWCSSTCLSMISVIWTVGSAPSSSLLMIRGWVVQLICGGSAIWSGSNKLEKWVHMNLMRFNKAKCCSYLGQSCICVQNGRGITEWHRLEGTLKFQWPWVGTLGRITTR